MGNDTNNVSNLNTFIALTNQMICFAWLAVRCSTDV